MRLTLVAEIGTHLDHPPDDELATLGAAWREEDVEVVLTILPPVELIEDPVGERAEALGAHEARGVKELPVRVDNLGFGLKAIVTTRAGDALQVHDARHPVEEVGALALGHLGARISSSQAVCWGGTAAAVQMCCCLVVGPARLPGSARPQLLLSSCLLLLLLLLENRYLSDWAGWDGAKYGAWTPLNTRAHLPLLLLNFQLDLIVLALVVCFDVPDTSHI